MHTTQYNQNYSPAKVVPVPTPVGGIVAMGVAGALVTGSVVAAAELRKEKTDEQSRAQAVAKVGKEALGSGLAWAAGAAVAKTLFRSNILGILAMVAVSAGVKYAYDGFTAPKAETADVPAKPAKTKETRGT